MLRKCKCSGVLCNKDEFESVPFEGQDIQLHPLGKFLAVTNTKKTNGVEHGEIRLYSLNWFQEIISETPVIYTAPNNFYCLNTGPGTGWINYDTSYNYPYDGSVDFNLKISQLTADGDKKIGPSKILPAKRGDRMTVSTRYFYVEDAPGQSYNLLTTLVDEILISLAGTGSGVLPLNENQLLSIANGENGFAEDLYSFLSQQIDTTNMSRPHAYMVYTYYDENFEIVPSVSRVIQVQDPNELGTLADLDIQLPANGYMHAGVYPELVEWVSNGSSAVVNFDNFMITYMRGKTRQFNDYYPYGLNITGLNGYSNEYPYKYQGKEYQSGEWNLDDDGLEQYDFDARFYDPALGRWFVPDPAEQFHNPYLAMGNNPVMYVDPDGEFIFAAALTLSTFLLGSMMDHSLNMDDYNHKNLGESLGAGIKAGLNAYNTVSSIGSFSIPINDNLSFYMGLSFTGLGLMGGLNYNNDGFSFSLGSSGQYGLNANSGLNGIGTTLSGGVGYFNKKWRSGLSVGISQYGGIQESQALWQVNFHHKDWTFSTSNDAWLSEDKFRTAAGQLSYKDASIGMSIYTTDPPEDEHKSGQCDNLTFHSPIYGENTRKLTKKNPVINRPGTYSTGDRRYAGLYLGYKSGVAVTRMGVDAPWVQDFFQNGIHQAIGSPYFNTNYGPPTRFFRRIFCITHIHYINEIVIIHNFNCNNSSMFFQANLWDKKFYDLSRRIRASSI